MIDLKRTKAQIKKENSPRAIGGDYEQYPWGTRLRFNKPEIDKFDVLKKSAAGEQVSIRAVGKIVEVSTSASEKGRAHHSVEIQITRIEITGKEKDMPEDEKDAFEE